MGHDMVAILLEFALVEERGWPSLLGEFDRIILVVGESIRYSDGVCKRRFEGCEKSEIFIGLDVGSYPVMNSGKGEWIWYVTGWGRLNERDILVFQNCAKVRFDSDVFDKSISYLILFHSI